MKKLAVGVCAFLLFFSFAVSGAMAQATWTWQYAPISEPTGVTELTADPATDSLYGLSAGTVGAISTGSFLTTGGQLTPGSPPYDFTDIAVGFQGAVYAITDKAVASCVPPADCALLPEQPIVPADTDGVYKAIAAGKNGKLFILYEVAADDQYILAGTPPVQTALTIKLNPQSLNLGSKGNWVTCLIEMTGYDIKGIDPASVVVTQFVIDGNPVDVEIPVDPSAPYDFGTSKLMVKFKRYNKADPDDPASFVGVLSGELPPGPSKGTVPVKATIQATHDVAGQVSGEADFRIIVPKAKKQK